MDSVSTEIYLLPGEHAVGRAQGRIRTLLGSCVSITLWHPRLRVGAMSHFLLPGDDRHRGPALNGRYGQDALALMLMELRVLGAEPQHCEAKLFGGGAMFACEGPLGAVGWRNGEAARHMLAERGIRVVSESLYEAGHREIIFHLDSGEVWVRHARLDEGAARGGMKGGIRCGTPGGMTAGLKPGLSSGAKVGMKVGIKASIQAGTKCGMRPGPSSA